MTKRLNAHHKQILDLLRTGPRKGDQIALATRIPIRQVATALRALKRAECVGLTPDQGLALTQKGRLLALAYHQRSLRKAQQKRQP